MVVVFENADYEEALRQPPFAELAKRGALLTNLRAKTHPSQPNYIALVSGSLRGVSSNDAVDLEARHLGDLLEEKGLSWKAYLEDYPGGCYTGDKSRNYVRKHNPFISFRNVQSSASRCARLVEARKLDKDLRSGALPDFSLYVPNLENDGHDTSAGFAPRWLSKQLLPLLEKRLAKDLLLIVTYDEAKSDENNRVYTALLGRDVEPGARSPAAYDHYSVLRTIEDRLKLKTLGANDARAAPIEGIWKKKARLSKSSATTSGDCPPPS
jgi:hypothetical protein